MKGYDLDGVICPEYTWIEGATPEEVLARTFDLRPIFQPKDDYYIITGRTNVDTTLAWIDAKLHKKPVKTFINSQGLQPAYYKATILNSNPQITMFFESEFEQANEIQLLTNIDIIWIDSNFT